ncbi:MAG: DUF4395 domain-containing protein [Spirochaetia bacterium]
MKKDAQPTLVNEAVVRGTAFQVFLLAAAAVIWGGYIPVIVLAVDFFIRFVLKPRYSLLVLISKSAVVPVLRFKSRNILYRPKRFAAGIGLFLSLAGLVLAFLGQVKAMRFAAGLLGLFSFLEAFFRFCAGCKIFGLLVRWGIADEGLCTDCVYPGDGEI